VKTEILFSRKEYSRVSGVERKVKMRKLKIFHL